MMKKHNVQGNTQPKATLAIAPVVPVRCAVYLRYAAYIALCPTIDEQEQRCRAYANERGWEVPPEHVYADLGVSGVKPVKRKALNMLLTAAQQSPRPFDFVVTDDTARLGRNIANVMMPIKILRASGIEVHFVCSGLNSGNLCFLNFVKCYSMVDKQYLIQRLNLAPAQAIVSHLGQRRSRG